MFRCRPTEATLPIVFTRRSRAATTAWTVRSLPRAWASSGPELNSCLQVSLLVSRGKGKRGSVIRPKLTTSLVTMQPPE